MNEAELLNKIMETQFACIDLNLYLDTHPYDEIAIADYNCFAKQLDELKREYDYRYGTLQNFGNSQANYPFTWVQQDFPI